MQIGDKPVALGFIGKSKSSEYVPTREKLSSLEEDGYARSPLGSEFTCQEEQQAADKLLHARKKLEEEIEVSGSISGVEVLYVGACTACLYSAPVSIRSVLLPN